MLFHRVHRSVILTDVGREYAAEVIAAFAQLKRRRDGGERQRHVRADDPFDARASPRSG